MYKVFTCVLDGKRFVGPVKYYAPDFKPCCSKSCANLVYINKHLSNIDEAKKYVEKSIFSANNAYSQNSKYEKLYMKT
jgi:hypothetical protein